MNPGPAFIYWEQDSEFQFTQIRSLHGDLHLGTIGHHWSEGALPLSIEDWEHHRTELERRAPFTDFVYARLSRTEKPEFFRVSGTPTFDERGQFTGYRGLATDASSGIEQRRTAWLAKQTLRSFDAPIIWIEESRSDHRSWQVIWANIAACSVFGRAVEELQAASPESLFDARTGGPAAIGRVLSERRSEELNVTAWSKYGSPRALRLRVDASTEMPNAASLPRRALLIAADTNTGRFMPGQSAPAAPALSVPPGVTSTNPAHMAEFESFSFAVSHDLRAPLRLIEGFARILQEDYAPTLDKIGNDHVQRILLAASRMGQMVESLLDLSRISAQPLAREPVDLSELANSILEDLGAADPARQVDVDVQPALRVWGDRVLLRIALTNLFSNAWKYTAPGNNAQIKFRLLETAGTSAYCVSDNGVGFDMRFVDRLFNPFQRLHSVTDFPGTGIGLATTKRVINRHGGQVWAESRAGVGSQFFFTLSERTSNRANQAEPSSFIEKIVN